MVLPPIRFGESQDVAAEHERGVAGRQFQAGAETVMI
jgi:hypothetical protein